MDAQRLVRYEDEAPASEPMRAQQRRVRSNPTPEDRKVRRRNRAPQRASQPRTAALQCLACGCAGHGAVRGSMCPACGSLAIQAKDEYLRHTDWDEFHPGDKYPDARIHRAIRITPDDHDLWKRAGQKDLSDDDRADVAHKLMGHIQQNPNLGMHWTDEEHHAYTVLHSGQWTTPGRTWSADHDLKRGKGLPISVVVHAKWPKKEHLETDPETLKRYDVKSYTDPEALAQEAEVPVKHDAPMHVTGLSWSHYETPRKSDFTHHEFSEPIRHQATRLDTQIERLTDGDQLLTPQGQSVNVKKVRPHETESGKVYVDTDMGTSIMDRGTSVKYVPKGGHSSVQQELPNSGNPQGNVGRMPGAGDMTPSKAPMCPVDGTKMVFRNNNWVCPKDGTTAPTSAAPAGMAPTDWGHGQMVNRQPGRPVQRAHVWGAYITTERPSLVAREAQRVLSTMEENRS